MTTKTRPFRSKHDFFRHPGLRQGSSDSGVVVNCGTIDGLRLVLLDGLKRQTTKTGRAIARFWSYLVGERSPRRGAPVSSAERGATVLVVRRVDRLAAGCLALFSSAGTVGCGGGRLYEAATVHSAENGAGAIALDQAYPIARKDTFPPGGTLVLRARRHDCRARSRVRRVVHRRRGLVHADARRQGGARGGRAGMLHPEGDEDLWPSQRGDPDGACVRRSKGGEDRLRDHSPRTSGARPIVCVLIGIAFGRAERELQFRP